MMKTIEHVAEYAIYTGANVELVTRILDRSTDPEEHAQLLARRYMADNPGCHKINWKINRVTTLTTIDMIASCEMVRNNDANDN